jgi:TetR/AcrR family transcriptional regulator, fatty acid metabolism regulator protein
VRATKKSTLTTEARRLQIVDAAITVLARDGLSQTSLGRIATQAGLSSAGLITYHFADKDDVLLTVTRTLLGRALAALRKATSTADGPVAALDAYIETFVGFQAANPEGVRALWRLAAGWKAPGRDDAFDGEQLCEPLKEVLARGIDAGVFRQLDVTTVALGIARSIETFPEAGAADPAPFVRELQTLYRRGIASDG